MGYDIIIKSVFSFLWKFKTVILFLLLLIILYGGYKYINKLNSELEDVKDVAEVAIKEHNKVINNYKETSEELKDNQEKKLKLEATNKTLRKKLEEAMRGKNETWSNTPIPDSVRLLLEQGTQKPQQ